MIEKLLKNWKEKGRRMTKVRTALLDLFMSDPGPLTVDEVAKRLKKKHVTAAPSTLYRELDFLLAEGVLTEVILDGSKRRFEWKQSDHHHHLYCEKCNKIEEMEMENELGALELSIQKKKGFKIKTHTLEFFGLCKNCKR